MRVLLLCGLIVLLMVTLTATAPRTTSEIIDGKQTTIALAVAHLLIGLIPNETVQGLLVTIIDALTQEDFDYWEEVKDDVTALVGQYINEHNMHQVEVYQNDLVTLMDRYNNAPVSSDTYPDKNQQATALSTSIVTHRYLIEAAELPQSMMLHFEDISSIHVTVLKDVAETYSVEGHPPSRWWVDLDEELDHYIGYGRGLQVDLRDWRLGMVICSVDVVGVFRRYDVYTATDLVTGEVSTCQQLHGADDCSDHCALFRQHKANEVQVFMAAKVDDVLSSWELLKNISSVYAATSSRFYDPVRER
nr:uncharacterized protein LOC128699627 [Cherax quadricarinatus]